MDNIIKLVDEVFDGGFNQFGKIRSAEKQIDILLEKVKDVDLGKGSLSTTGRPYDHPIKARVVPSLDGKAEVAVDECAGPLMSEEEGFEASEYDEGPAKEEDPKKLSNKINTVPNQNVGGLLKSIHGQLTEMRINEDYKAYFKSMLKKYGYNSPADIPADKKKEFFNAIDKGWKGKDEKVEEGRVGDVAGAFKKEKEIKKSGMNPAQKKMAWAKHMVSMCKKDAVRHKWPPEKLKKCIDSSMAKARK